MRMHQPAERPELRTLERAIIEAYFVVGLRGGTEPAMGAQHHFGG
ncbi:Uncharacterised protein [Yersinia frederiksenii]|nr:Uncharacterised protein [Yersinia frederiksenii]CNM17798.1 Uncharacterised protein [Yersinia frederiksenii]